MRAVGSTLAYGVHLGKSELRMELPGFSASVLQPTFHEEDVSLHTHDSASLVFVLEGVYRTSADGSRGLSSGPILIFNPAGTTHRDSFVKPQGRFLAVSVSKDMTRIASSEGQLPKAAVSFVVGHSLTMAKHLVRELQCGKPYRSPVLEDACWELLAAASGVPLPEGRSNAFLPPWLSNIRSILNECTEVQPMTSIAYELGIHPVYLARRFRQYFGCSPAEYRMRCRLRRAMELLRRSDSSLARIAHDIGFYDQSHFTHAFKEQFGHAPGVYRSKLKRAD